MKTRIIQDEPEAGEAGRGPEGGSGAPQPDRNSPWLRRGVVFLAVAGYFVLGVVHPPDPEVGDESTLFFYLHVFQPVLIGLVAWSLILLVEDLPGRAAQITRYAVIPYAIAYTIFDSIIGISVGMIVREANSMSSADAAAVKRMVDGIGGELVPYAAWAASGLTWLVAAGATAIAVKQVGGRGPSTLMAIGAVVFAVGHPFPSGPIGIGLFGLGVVWLELRRARASVPAPVPAPESQPVLAP